MATEGLLGALFKNMSMVDIVQLIQVQNLKGLYQRVLGGGAKPTTTTTTDDGTKIAKDDGKGVDDEYQFLIAAAEAYGRDLFGKDITQVDPAVIKAELARNRVSKMNAIAKALRAKSGPGAVTKLMHIIGHESHLQGRTEKRTSNGQKPKDQTNPFQYLEAKHRTNPSGQLIMLYLTSMTVDEAVDLLIGWSITDNPGDTARATVKVGKDKIDELLESAKQYYGRHDTKLHIKAATLAIGEENVKRILASHPAQRLLQAIDTADDSNRREHQEVFQAFLLASVKDFKNPVVVPTQEHESAWWKGFTLTMNKAIGILALICVACLIFLAYA